TTVAPRERTNLDFLRTISRTSPEFPAVRQGVIQELRDRFGEVAETMIQQWNDIFEPTRPSLESAQDWLDECARVLDFAARILEPDNASWELLSTVVEEFLVHASLTLVMSGATSEATNLLQKRLEKLSQQKFRQRKARWTANQQAAAPGDSSPRAPGFFRDLKDEAVQSFLSRVGFWDSGPRGLGDALWEQDFTSKTVELQKASFQDWAQGL